MKDVWAYGQGVKGHKIQENAIHYNIIHIVRLLHKQRPQRKKKSPIKIQEIKFFERNQK
jgi:hypothetical protein